MIVEVKYDDGVLQSKSDSKCPSHGPFKQHAAQKQSQKESLIFICHRGLFTTQNCSQTDSKESSGVGCLGHKETKCAHWGVSNSRKSAGPSGCPQNAPRSRLRSRIPKCTTAATTLLSKKYQWRAVVRFGTAGKSNVNSFEASHDRAPVIARANTAAAHLCLAKDDDRKLTSCHSVGAKLEGEERAAEITKECF